VVCREGNAGRRAEAGQRQGKGVRRVTVQEGGWVAGRVICMRQYRQTQREAGGRMGSGGKEEWQRTQSEWMTAGQRPCAPEGGGSTESG
jgi:hypothetical protein